MDSLSDKSILNHETSRRERMQSASDARARALMALMHGAAGATPATSFWRNPLAWWRTRRNRAKAMARIAEFNRQVRLDTVKFTDPTTRNH